MPYIDPFLVLGLSLLAFLYYRGINTLWQRAGVGKGVSIYRVSAFSAGLVTFVLAVMSPLDTLAHMLFSAHMFQHLILMMLTAPLLIYGSALVPVLWGLPRPLRLRLVKVWQGQKRLRGVLHAVMNPFIVTIIFTLALWVWHAPVFYEAALQNRVIHGLEHIFFLGSAMLFWWHIINPLGRRRLGYGAAVLYVFITTLQSGLLGALLTFSGTPLYSYYEHTTVLYGMTPLEDQVLAGLIMWIPTGIVYLVVACILFYLFMQELEERQKLERKMWVQPGD